MLLELFGLLKVHLVRISFMDALLSFEFLAVQYVMVSLKDNYVQPVLFGNYPHFQEPGDRVHIYSDTL